MWAVVGNGQGVVAMAAAESSLLKWEVASNFSVRRASVFRAEILLLLTLWFGAKFAAALEGMP